ncbi:MAG: sugar ABC transporter permease [Clostridia bacterium]|nr:sugar ABC transporter permease [Clostridia bacterium]
MLNNSYITKKHVKHKPLLKRITQCWELYLFMIPAVVLVVLFSYVPMYGVQLAFKELTPGLSITESPWVGFEHFKRLFSLPDFPSLIKNTIKISLFSNLCTFPLPIIFALLLNQVESKYFKKTVQTVTYIPHLFSIVVVISITRLLLSPTSGIINHVIQQLGGDPVLFFGSDKYVLPLYIFTDIWQNLGYGAVIYIAALAGVDQAQLEAAKIDGCGRLRIIWHIELPAIAGTIITMQILRWGQLFNIGADKMLLLQNSLNLGASEVISTYVYKVGLLDGQFGFSTAVNLFNTIINIICLLIVNGAARKFSETSLF